MADRPGTWPRATNSLLPHTLFKLAAQYPELVYAEFPKNPHSVADGYRKITYREVANAVNAFAWWAEKNVGKPDKDDGTETMVYMGPNDLRYAILTLGSVMVGYKMIFPTPRYGAEALATLIGRVDGTIMLSPMSPFPVVAEILKRRPMRTYHIPSVEDLLASQTKPYPYTKTFEACKDEPLICLHSSGTTGFPKPIVWTHDWANSVAEGFYLPTPEGYERLDARFYWQTRSMFVFPPFHASGFFGSLFMQLFSGSTAVFPPTAASPGATMDAVADALDVLGEEGKCHLIAAPPPHMEYLGANPTLLSRVSATIKSAFFGGGDLSHAAGNAIASKMQFFDDMGSTELGIWPCLGKSGQWSNKDRGDLWHYIMFHPAMNIRFDLLSEDAEGGLYEAVIVRNEGDDAWVQPIFKISPHEKEIKLGDLFTQHPTEKGLWKHYGRADDLLVFITSEKFHPGAAERRLAALPGVAEVMIVGTRRARAALIIRLEEGAHLDELWEGIEEINNDSPVYARVARDMILPVTEPFLKTAKGTVQKKAMVDLREKELDALYANAKGSVPTPYQVAC